MVLRIIIIVSFNVLFLSACKQEVENKGGEIPPATVFNAPLNMDKQIVYLNALIKENAQPQLLFYRARAYFFTHQYHLAKLDLDQLFNRSNEINEEYILLNAWVNIRLGNTERALELVNLSTFSKHKTTETLPLFFELYAEKRMISATKNVFNLLGKQLNTSKEFIQVGQLLINGDTLKVSTYFARNPLGSYENDYLNKNYLKFALFSAPALQYQKVCLDLLKIYPFDAFYLNYWAKFLAKMNKIDQAEKVFLTSIQMLPENQNFNFDIAKFYFQAKNYSKAITYFSMISSGHFNYQESQYHKAVSLVFLGKKIEAKIVIDSLLVKSNGINLWTNKFYTNFLHKNDSTQIAKDSLSNLNQ